MQVLRQNRQQAQVSDPTPRESKQERVSIEAMAAANHESSIEQLLAMLRERSQQQETGRLEVRTQLCYWYLYFELGHLTWASGGLHPQRRWRRQFIRACRNSDFRSSYPAQDALRLRDRFEAWDYHLILALHKRQQIEAEQLRQIVTATTAEVLFDLFRAGSDLALRLQPGKTSDKPFVTAWSANLRPSLNLTIPSSWVEPLDNILRQTQAAWGAWKQAGLGPYSPDMCPVIRQPKQLQTHASPATYKNLSLLLNGERSLRDLAVMMRSEPLKVARPLLPYVQHEVIAFDTLRDLPPRVPAPTAVEKSDQTDNSNNSGGRRSFDSNLSPLVACIDDSAQSCQIAERLLTQAGYRSFSIQDPIQVLPSLVAKKPDLILLDLIMPAISGYELCSQIRRIPRLRETPIIIVTGSDGLVDRVRAKLVGATDFLSKPLSSKRLQQALQYLPGNKPAESP